MEMNEEVIAALVAQGTQLAFRLVMLEAQKNGRPEPIASDFNAVQLRLSRVLDSGNTLGELDNQLKDIADGPGA